jgi:hypothetical protein
VLLLIRKVLVKIGLDVKFSKGGSMLHVPDCWLQPTLLKDTSSLWLCEACLSNVMKYLPTTDAIDKNYDVTDSLDAVKVELMSINDRVSKTL